MLESLMRSQAPRFFTIYDRMPHPVRHVITSARGFALPRNRSRSTTMALLSELRSHEQWTDEEIALDQMARLRSLIQHARRTCAFYRDYAEPSGETPKEVLARYPVLRRETVRHQAQRMLSATTREGDRIRVGTTGTTGAALKVAYDDEAARLIWAHSLRQWMWAGLKTDEPRVTFFGSRVVPAQRKKPPFWTFNAAENQWLASSFHLSSGTAGNYLRFLQRNSGKVLEAFPSVLGILADFVLEQGIVIPMKAVLTSGEPLYPFLREKAERAFRTRVYDSYGMTELCGVIQECEHGGMHLAPESAVLEILDEHDQPVANGDEGFLVWTGFINTAMPFIRYRVGDRGRWDLSGPCACGRRFPLVVPTITRDSDLLRCPDGRIFSPRTLNQTLKNATSFRFCQFIHDGASGLSVRVVTGAPERAAHELEEVFAGLRKILGPAMRISGCFEQEPVMRAGGKIPLILRMPASQEVAS